MLGVALYLDSTSNHNYLAANDNKNTLLYILILHQTTTANVIKFFFPLLLYILILHQTTTGIVIIWSSLSCFISWFYIKPQQTAHQGKTKHCCFISWFYIKPQQPPLPVLRQWGCFISWFYIKPQRAAFSSTSKTVALYLDSTSNHNALCRCLFSR